ncbi:MAG: methyl-accepting chemotaxis protein [Pseudomonadota bacterium]
MKARSPLSDNAARPGRFSRAAHELGYEGTDIEGCLKLLAERAKNQTDALIELDQNADVIGRATTDISAIVDDLSVSSEHAQAAVNTSTHLIRDVNESTRNLAAWVKSVHDRTGALGQILKAVKSNNAQIAAIAAQVNTLAINAKIEAARAGEAGRGFAVVADAINDLSQKTSGAADQISQNIESVKDWVTELEDQAESVAGDADVLLVKNAETDDALHLMEQSVKAQYEQVSQLVTCKTMVQDASAALHAEIDRVNAVLTDTVENISKARDRIQTLASH